MTACAARLGDGIVRPPPWACLALLSVVGIGAGWLLATKPWAAFVPAGLLLSMPLLVSPRARVIFIVFGGLLVFQTSEGFSLRKLVFLLGAGVAMLGAFLHTRHLTRSAAYRDLAPLLLASLVLCGMLAVSLPVSMSSGTPVGAWMRDIASYVLFAAAPLLAIDAQSDLSGRGLRTLLVLAGITGAAFFGATWLSTRGIADVSSAAIGLPTFLLGAALFAFAMAVIVDGRRGWGLWLLLGSVLFATLLATGTRTTVVLLAAPIAIVLGSRERFAHRVVRLAIVIPLATLLVVLGIQAGLALANADQSTVQERVSIALKTGSSADYSYRDRLSQTRAAWELFTDSPFLGKGPGHPIVWRESSSTRVSHEPTIDSPAAYLAKFGLFGLLPLLVLVVATAQTLRRLRLRSGRRTTAHLGLLGFIGVVIAWSFLQVPFEDKGLAAGVLLLLAVAAREAHAADEATRPVTEA